MKNTDLQSDIQIKESRETDENKYPGYEPYPPDEDIYSKNKQETMIDPERIAAERNYPKTGVLPHLETDRDVSELDLDVPGSELDDDLESVGSEDEENNYYSITDDNFDDLEDVLDR